MRQFPSFLLLQAQPRIFWPMGYGSIGNAFVAMLMMSFAVAPAVSAQRESASSNSVALVAALSRLENGFRGKTVELELSFVNMYRDSVPSSKARISLSGDGQFVRETQWIYDVHADEKNVPVGDGKSIEIIAELCAFCGQGDFSGQEIRGSKIFRNGGAGYPYEAYGAFYTPGVNVIEVKGAGVLGGYSVDDAMPFTHLLAMPEVTINVVETKFGDETAKKYSVDIPGTGQYEFIVSGEIPLVRSINIRKIRRGEVIDKTGGGGWAVERTGDGRERSVLGIEYKFENNDWIPISSTSTTSTTRLGESDKDPGRVAKIVVTKIEEFSVDDTTRAQFLEIPVKNGMPIRVAGKEGLAYSFVDGRIVRGIDHESIAEIDGVRFRKPTGSRWKWYGFGAAGILLLVVVMVYARQSMRG